MQERLEGTSRHPPPRHQIRGQHHTRPGVEVVEAEQRGQVPVHRRRAADRGGVVEHDHVVRRRPQPGHEP